MEKTWWKKGIAYQVYVRSFKDSNRDGIGDLKGIIEKLDYLKDLGVDIIYFNPINKSPNYDNGYDISDYRDIMDEFGTVEDLELLMEELKKRRMRFVLDLVLNHTSHEHPWFVESRKGKDNPYRDYYIWHPGKKGGTVPPNNWGSFFGGSVWEYDEESEEYYFHLFAPEQPDLNWRNENVRREMKEIIKYWLDLGVDGFRLDAINHLEKDFTFLDAPINPNSGYSTVYGDGLKYIQNLPEVHGYLKELRKDAFSMKDCVVIGETGSVNHENAFLYTGDDRKELDMVFHFDMHNLGNAVESWKKGRVNLITDIKEKMSGWQIRPESEGWCPLFFSNHDMARPISRLGNDKEFWKESAKMLATMQLTQKGTPFIYNGDEIGMTNAWDYELEDYRDSCIITRLKNLVNNGTMTEENFIDSLRHTARDNSRTPMQWEDSKNAGFSSGEPWIRVNSNYKDINVERQLKDEDSILSYYKKIIKLRKENDVLVFGSFIELCRENEQVYSYIRELDGERMLIVFNFFEDEAKFCLPDYVECGEVELLLSNYKSVDNNIRNVRLRPYEARIYKLK